MTIIDKIIDCFENAKSPGVRLNKLQIKRFVIGSKLNAELGDTRLQERMQKHNWSADELLMFKNSPVSDWAINHSKNSRLSSLINEEDFDFDSIKYSLDVLMREYNLHLPIATSFAENFKNFSALAIWNISNPIFLFTPYTHARLTHYSSWPDKEKELHDLLESHNIIFVTGRPACGKTLLIKSVLKKYYGSGFDYASDIYFAEKKYSSIEGQIRHIKFLDSEHDLKTALFRLKKKPKTSFLILHQPFLTDEDFKFIQTHLLGLRLKIIITTQTRILPEVFKHIEITNWPESSLKGIFMNAPNKHHISFTDKEFSTLFELASYHPYAVSLVVKSLNEPKTFEEATMFKEYFINKTEGIWNLSKQPKAHETYNARGTQSTVTVPTLISYMLDYYGNTETYLPLSVWARSPVSKQLLIRFTNISPAEIDSALQRGLLEYVDDTRLTIVMPTIIADTIWNEHSQSFYFKDYCNKLEEFLMHLGPGSPIALSYRTLYPVIRNMVQRFHFQFYKLSSDKKVDSFTEFSEWNHLLIKLIYRLTELGNYEIAKEFLPYILYYKKSKKICDAANSGEQLIRNVIAFKTSFMIEGRTENNLLFFNNIHQQTIALLKSESPDFNDLIPSITLSLMAHQNFLDCELRAEKNILLEYIMTKNSDILAPIDHLFKTIRDFINFFNKFSSKIPFAKACYHYYSLIMVFCYGARNQEYDDTWNNMLMISHQHYSALESTASEFEELWLKVNCQKLCYSLIDFYMHDNFSNLLHNKESLAALESEYNWLASRLIGKVRPFDLMWTFYICMIYLCPARKFVEPVTLNFLRETWNSMNALAYDQLTLLPSERSELLKMITTFEKEIPPLIF